MRTIELEKCWDDDTDWYSLQGGGQWASVEGTAEEWREIARAMKGRHHESFRRCAVACRVDGTVHLWSPRNATGDSDVVKLTEAEARTLEDQIVALLGGAKEKE